MVIKFTWKAIWFRNFVFWDFIHYWFYFISSYQAVQIFCFILVQSGYSGFSSDCISLSPFNSICMVLEIYPFPPGCLICWHIIVNSSFLQFFVFLWCQLSLLFHFLILFIWALLFSLDEYLKVYQFCLSFHWTSSWFHWSSVFCFGGFF